MDKTKYNELIQHALSAEPVEFKNRFEDIMQNKVDEVVDGLKHTLVFDMFNKKEEDTNG
jgi:hypothetical protein